MKLLWGALNKDTDFNSWLAMKRDVSVVNLTSVLPQLRDPHSFLLFRSCMGNPKLFFRLWIFQPVLMDVTTLFFDKTLGGSIEDRVVCGGPFFGGIQWRLSYLLIPFGILVIYSTKLASSYAFGLKGPILGFTRPHLT